GVAGIAMHLRRRAEEDVPGDVDGPRGVPLSRRVTCPLSRLRGEGIRLRATGSRIPARPRALARAGVRSRVGVRGFCLCLCLCFCFLRKAALICPSGTFSRKREKGSKRAVPYYQPLLRR